MSLPSGFVRVEYIESTGTQYIDSLFKPNQNTRVLLDIYLPVQASYPKPFLGGRNGDASSDKSFVLWAFDAYSFRSDFNTKNLTIAVVPVGRLSIDKNKNVTTINGVAYANTEATFQSDYNLAIFTLIDSGGTETRKAAGKLYSCKIWDNGTLVRDFIPCKNASGEVGLWDDVNGVFYGNAGTGAFVAGPAAEIVELEYIESTGEQYIDSLFTPNQDTRVVCSAKFPATPTSDSALLGVRNSNTGQFWCYYRPSANAFSFRIGDSSTNNLVAANPTEKNYVDANKNVLTVGANSVTANAATFTATYSMFVFAVNNAGTSQYPASVQLASLQIYDNGLLVRDYVPAKTIEGEIGLYDKVFGEFYRNAGSGTFIAGPEVEGRDYVDLEHIESTGSQYVDTGVVANNKSSLTIKFSTTQQSNGGICVAMEKWQTRGFGVFVNAIIFGASSKLTNGLFGDGEIHEVTLNSNAECYDNGKLLWTGTVSEFTAPETLTICKSHVTSETDEFAEIKVCVCQIRDNGVVVRDYISKRHPSGVVGLWDKANSRFYASATTTDFIGGPEKILIPATPTGLTAATIGEGQVLLTWNASDKATGYRLYRDNILIADTAETSYADTPVLDAGHLYAVSAYSDLGESVISETVAYGYIPIDAILRLITDRTQADVAALQALLAKAKAGTITDEEWAVLAKPTHKGAYNYTDLNRVNAAMQYLVSLLRGYGYAVAGYQQDNTVWTVNTIPYHATMQRYVENVSAIRAALAMLSTTPESPGDMEKLTVDEANAIEKILVDCETVINAMSRIMPRAAQPLVMCGFVLYPAQTEEYVEPEYLAVYTADGLAVYTSNGLPVYLTS